MTLVRRTFVALCIALATALTVAGLALIDAGGASSGLERIHRN